jgi:hypothetical protein
MNRLLVILGVVTLGIATLGRAEDYYHEPILYESAKASNVIATLQSKFDDGSLKPAYHDEFGYLPWLLGQLNVSTKSQMLVFSKTSVQRNKISPETPRALYFNDDVYVGYCQNGDILEIAAVDPGLGTVFYTLDQHKEEQPRFRRQSDNCLLCHGGSQTREIPGHLVRSLFVDPQGLPILSAGSHRIDHTSPIEQRWGGWYVTGKHGDLKHLGNLVIRTRRVPDTIDNKEGLNVTDLGDRIDKRRYLSPHSDIVALMVLEHQTEGQNLLIRANFATRTALHLEQNLNREMKMPLDHRWGSTLSRMKGACDPLVKYLLFCDEATWTGKIEGTSGFAEEFARGGKRDPQGRSLRELNLQGRLFRYPCSYLIQSQQFDVLPPLAREYVLQRILDVLTGKDTSSAFKHLSTADRKAILEILRATVKDLPAAWQAAG